MNRQQNNNTKARYGGHNNSNNNQGGSKRYNGGGQGQNQSSNNGQYGGGANRNSNQGGGSGYHQKPRYNDYDHDDYSQGKENNYRGNQGYQNRHNPEQNDSYQGGRPQTSKPAYKNNQQSGATQYGSNGGYGGGKPTGQREQQQQHYQKPSHASDMPLKNAFQNPTPPPSSASQQQQPGNNPFAGLKAQGFPGKPQASSKAATGQQYSQQHQTSNRSSHAVVPRENRSSQHMQQVSLLSNQYKLVLGKNVPVWQYVLEVYPDEFWEAHLVHEIIRTKKKALEAALGHYVPSGKTIYTLTQLEETLVFKTTFRGEKAEIKIDVETGTQIQLTDTFNNKDNDVSQNLINVILKQAFRETNLKQLGRSPRFFDVNNPINLDRIGLRMWSGFKASAFQSELGVTLAVDNIFKFMTTKTCLERIMEMRNDYQSNHQWHQAVRLEFAGKSIIADWGNKRTYRVDDVDFEVTPVTHEFVWNDQTITLAGYFQTVYGKVVSDVNQPVFMVKLGDQMQYLPSEFCLLDGVPDSIRKGAGMRDALAMTRITPTDKIKQIQQMVDLLATQKSMNNWGLQIEEVPISLESSILGAPQIQLLSSGQIIQCSEQSLKRLPIQKAVDLLEGEWVMIYQNPERPNPRKRSNFQIADSVYNTFVQASNALKIKVQDPYFIELEAENDYAEVKGKLLDYMMDGPNSVFRHPKVIVVVLGQEHNYKMYKELFHEFKIPSQVVTTRNGFKFNMSKASNILRQINSKIEGDLFHLQFPKVMDNMKTMLIGIDVCHAGPNSVVGFAASTNKEMSQYYSEYIVQKKGQEIVETQMKESLKKAIEVFATHHKREFPTNFIIFRDGVGDAQRDQVIDKEIKQFREAFAELYNKAGVQPQITLVVVNKRITQRFFVKDNRGNLINPPSGCIVDKGLVEHSDESGAFDFFMMPSGANQGCVLPTHFHVPLNESSLRKIDLQQLTYGLCHFYYNWAGPIKVPAPCQYAHKIADFYMTIGAAKKGRGGDRKPQGGWNVQQEGQIKQKCIEVKPLNHKLHYL